MLESYIFFTIALAVMSFFFALGATFAPAYADRHKKENRDKATLFGLLCVLSPAWPVLIGALLLLFLTYCPYRVIRLIFKGH